MDHNLNYVAIINNITRFIKKHVKNVIVLVLKLGK